jgi:hypothetical protein
MLKSTSLWLTYLLALLYSLLGGLLFFMPAQFSGQFAWKVSPFVTMTIGAWCLGNAWLALITATRWDWSRVRTALLYLWLFGLFEAGVLLVFRERVQLSSPMAWLYVGTLLVNVLAAVWGIAEWVRRGPPIEAAADKPTRTMRVLIGGFVVFVAFLGIFGAMRGLNGQGTGGAVFPEPMTAFSLSAFAAFYLALALGVLPLLWARDRETVMHHGFASYGLVIIITIATLVYIDRFDFVARPLGWIYIGAYVLVAAVTAIYFFKYGTGGERSATRLTARAASG